MQPHRVLYHWDPPIELQLGVELQGWLNPVIADHFVEFSNLHTAAHNNMLLSHGRAVQHFRELKKSSEVQGKTRISIVLSHDYSQPRLVAARCVAVIYLLFTTLLQIGTGLNGHMTTA